jgi:cobalamin biosynthesis Mg chelatase CobN
MTKQGITRSQQEVTRKSKEVTRKSKRGRMWVVYIEMTVALVLAVLIVWWTWPKKPPKDD